MKTIGMSIVLIVNLMLLVNPVSARGISEAELKEAFSGKTVEGHHNKKNFSFRRYYDSNGTLYGESNKKGKREGKWSVKDGRLCEQWAGKRLKCRDVEKHGNKIQKYNDNDIKVVTYKTFTTGNTLSTSSNSITNKNGSPNNDTKARGSSDHKTTTINNLEQFVAFFSGNTIDGYHSKKDFKFRRFFSPNGKVLEVSDRLGKRTGNWKLSKNRMCIQWEDRNNKCRIIEKNGYVVNQYNRKDNRKVITYKFNSAGNTL